MGAVVVDFVILEEIGGVLRWFMEALRPLSGVRYREAQGAGVVLEEPREEDPHEPGVVTDIVIAACRVKAIPIRSDWGLTRHWEYEVEPLEPVMRFRFAILDGDTYVMASCADRDRLLPAQKDFSDFLKRVQARFDVVGPFWQEYETQQIERRKEVLKRKFGDTHRGAAAAVVDGADEDGPRPAPDQMGIQPPGAGHPTNALEEQRTVDEAVTGIATKREHPEKRRKKQTVLAMRNEGRTLEEIAEAVEMSVTTVKRWLWEMSQK